MPKSRSSRHRCSLKNRPALERTRLRATRTFRRRNVSEAEDCKIRKISLASYSVVKWTNFQKKKTWMQFLKGWIFEGKILSAPSGRVWRRAYGVLAPGRGEITSNEGREKCNKRHQRRIENRHPYRDARLQNSLTHFYRSLSSKLQ